MTRWFWPILVVIGIMFGTCAWAQTDTGTPDNTVPTQPGPKPAYTYPDTTPSLDFLSDAAENSSITLGIGTGFTYDSNAYATGTSQNWWLFNVTPSIKIQQFLPRVAWNLSYAGGYQQYTGQNRNNANNTLFSQNAGAGILWQMSRHWQLSANDGFRYSADPFNSYLTIPGTPTMNNPNPVQYNPLTQYTLNTGDMSLTDQLTKVDTLSFIGTSTLRRTSTYNLVTSVPFYNLITYGGRGSYSHQLSPRLSLGASYNYNTLDFGHGQQRSGVQTMSGTVSYLLRPNLTISAWAGPEYTSTKTTVFIPFFGPIVSHESSWNAAFGGNFGWQGRRDSVRLGFNRQVTDGGGIIATSQVSSVSGSYHRMLTPKWDATVGGQYFHDVSTTFAVRSFDNYSLNAQLTYKLTKSLVALGQYGYIHQNQSNAILIGSGKYVANIVGVSVHYSWSHPLGR